MSIDRLYSDLEIAERIMGWKVISDENDCIRSVYDEVNETSYFMSLDEQSEWSPTQNIEQAFRVLEKVKCAWQIRSNDTGKPEQAYQVSLRVHSHVNIYPTTVQIEASELAEAICRAVLMIPDSYLILRDGDEDDE